MCLAVPMKVTKITGVQGEPDDFFLPPLATVEAEGVVQQVRLDIVDRFPAEGDYVIVHAGFAIHTLSPEDARKSLELFQEMAQDAGGE